MDTNEEVKGMIGSIRGHKCSHEPDQLDWK